MAVETFLKQADRKTFDCTVVNEENNWTPIMYAAKDNRVSILEKLISLGFNVNAKANDGLTALHVACSNAREDTIKLLMLKRVDTTVAGGVSFKLLYFSSINGNFLIYSIVSSLKINWHFTLYHQNRPAQPLCPFN